MNSETKIRELELVVYEYTVHGVGTDYNGFNIVCEKGGKLSQRSAVFRVTTDSGITGEYPCGSAGQAQYHLSLVADYLIGRNPFEREVIYNDLKRALRHTDRIAISMVDVALWDLAGKAYDVPIYRMLGGNNRPLPAYASTLHGDNGEGLCSPEAYADFAEECRERGYPAFKIHGWGNNQVDREIATVHAVREKVGDRMDLMIDPACELNTWAGALKLGRACDEARFFWLEDPYKDGGVSAFGHKKLRSLIKTPILQTEHIFGLEQHVDFIVAGGTDFVRTGVYEDGGITGAMKVAHAAEGFGLDVEFHGGGLAHRHCIAATRNTNYYELALVGPGIGNPIRAPIYPTEFLDELDSADPNGHVAVPEGPGLGVEIDWEFINAHQCDRIIRK